MIDEDVAGAERELLGGEFGVCDFCGRMAPRAALIRLAGHPDIAEPVETVLACPDCHVRIDQEEIPFDAEIAAGLQAVEE